MTGLYVEPLEEAKPAPYEGGRKAALMALEKFSVQGYAGTRNKIHGNVSRLSFYIRHGVLGLREVAERIRERSGQSYDALKFWQELGWRQFWRLVYARLGGRIYTDLEPPKVNLGETFPEELPEEIQKGKTGLICMDEGGGTGKGLFYKAIGHVIRTVTLDGKKFKMDKSFAMQRVELDTQMVLVEDCTKFMNFEGFYSMITEGVTIEKKNQPEVYLSYAKAIGIELKESYYKQAILNLQVAAKRFDGKKIQATLDL